MLFVPGLMKLGWSSFQLQHYSRQILSLVNLDWCTTVKIIPFCSNYLTLVLSILCCCLQLFQAISAHFSFASLHGHYLPKREFTNLCCLKWIGLILLIPFNILKWLSFKSALKRTMLIILISCTARWQSMQDWRVLFTELVINCQVCNWYANL